MIGIPQKAVAVCFSSLLLWAVARADSPAAGEGGRARARKSISSALVAQDDTSAVKESFRSRAKKKPRRRPTQEELEALRKAAEEAAPVEPEPSEEEKRFRARGLGLQALNPEISVSGDFININRESSAEDEVTRFEFREFALHLQSYLDPYSRFKASVPVTEEGVELEEAYFTRFALPAGTAVTLGKFKQQFGAVNRWHEHSLDWVDYPLPLRSIFGEEGLSDMGLALEVNGTVGGISTGLQLEVTSGENEVLLGANTRHRPSFLGHIKFFRDLTAATYAEIGLTGLLGWNDSWNVGGEEIERTLRSTAFGLDFTILWEPPGKMRYRNIAWRSELYMVDKRMPHPEGSEESSIVPWGFYASCTSKLTRMLETSLRFDYYSPAHRSWAGGEGASGNPLVLPIEDPHRWSVTGNLTWWQSPFVKMRLEYTHEDGRWLEPREDRIVFQCVFAAGPHKHERY